MRRIVSAVLASTLIAAMSEAHATPLVDQSYTGSSLSAILAEGEAYVGQSVTSGLSGYLVRVELEASRGSTFTIPWILDIQEVIAGNPTGTVLSSTLIDPTDFPINTGFEPPLVVELSSPVLFDAGDTFAIVLHPQGVEGHPGLFAGIWDGGCTSFSTFCYPGGQALFGPSANALAGDDYDLNFKTFVSQQVEEPRSLPLLVFGLGLMMVGFRGGRMAVLPGQPAAG